MSPRKPSTRRPTQRESAERSPPGSTETSRALILFEQMQGRFDAVLDAVVLNRRVLEDKIEQTRAKLQSNIEVLTTAVQHHSARIDKNSEEIRFLSERVDKHSDEIRFLSGRVDKNSEEIRFLSERVDKHSTEIRFLSERVDKHSDEIRFLSERVDKHSDEIRLVGEQIDRIGQWASRTLPSA